MVCGVVDDEAAVVEGFGEVVLACCVSVLLLNDVCRGLRKSCVVWSELACVAPDGVGLHEMQVGCLTSNWRGRSVDRKVILVAAGRWLQLSRKGGWNGRMAVVACAAVGRWTVATRKLQRALDASRGNYLAVYCMAARCAVGGTVRVEARPSTTCPTGVKRRGFAPPSKAGGGPSVGRVPGAACRRFDGEPINSQDCGQ